MTKEEIQAQIDILVSLQGSIDEDTDEILQKRIDKLELKLQSAKSIEDIILTKCLEVENQLLQQIKKLEDDKVKLINSLRLHLDKEREAFEAGRRVVDLDSTVWLHKTFEDYLKTLDNGTTKEI